MDFLAHKLNIDKNFISFVKAIISQQIERIDTGALALKIPNGGKEGQSLQDGHMHVNAEIFIQQKGSTRFQFQDQALTISPGEVCVIPTLIAHRESGGKVQGDFAYLVIMIEKEYLSFHIGKLNDNGVPYIFYIEGTKIDALWSFFNYVENICRYHWLKNERAEIISTNMFKVLLQSLDYFLSENTTLLYSVNEKIQNVRKIIFQEITNSELSVRYIAEKLNISADYISHYYKKETGQTIIEYINELRLEKAVYFLEKTVLNISEIAWACGYTEPGYFTRVFKERYKVSPKAFKSTLH
jgi:AraC-like DNA-binding protein